MRYLKLYLQINNKNTNNFRLLDIKAKINFNTTATVSGAVGEANIDIIGLSRNEMLYLATSTSPWNKKIIQNKIIIDAGYEDKHGIIFEGNIINATPDVSVPNYKISLKAISFFQNSLNNIQDYTYDGDVNIITILNDIASGLKLPLINSLNNIYIISNYHFKGSVIDNMRNLSKLYKLDVYIYNNRLIVKESGSPIKNISVVEISSKTGMLGSPIPTDKGCDVKFIMNSQLTTGQKVLLKSLKFPNLDSYYIIMTLAYEGDTYGNNWITNLTLIKEDIYE